MKTIRWARLIGPALAALALLTVSAAAPARAAPLEVVASFSILADITRQVGGDRVNVTGLVGPDEDAHGFQSRPSDVRRIRDADLLVANGLGFDPWMERLARSSGYRGTLVIATTGIEPIEEAGHDEHGHGHSHGHNHGAIDPHAWQDVRNVQTYVANITAALIATDPAGAALYRNNADRYTTELEALDIEIRTSLALLPDAGRKVVTSHDAFGYFAKAYDLQFLAAAGAGSRSEASAAAVAQLIRQLRRENVPVVFIENINDPRLIERIGSEGGARIGGRLHSDALSGPDGPAPTYIEMMRSNLNALMDGLRAAEQ